MNCGLSDEDLASHVVNNLRFKYESFILEQRTENDAGRSVSVEDLTNNMQRAFELYWKRKGKDPQKIAAKYNFDSEEKAERAQDALKATATNVERKGISPPNVGKMKRILRNVQATGNPH